MAPVLLPSPSYFVSVDGLALRTGMAGIEEQFRDLLENGAQAQRLPDQTRAAGQHLIPHSANQRGLYGTAAAMLVLGRSPPFDRRIALIEGLIRYLERRPAIEADLLRGEADIADLPGRLIRDELTVFKTADLVYALSAAPAAAEGREALLRRLLDKLAVSRRESGGWSVDHNPAHDRDALATASVVRSQHAAGIPVDDVDLRLVEGDAADPRVPAYVRSLCVLVVAEVSGGQDAASPWRELYEVLRPELRHRTESNYEFRIGQGLQYVRVPWQLYLIAGACLTRPASILLARDLRSRLLDCIRAVSSSEGYIYPASGQMKSTRTYAIAMDTLWRVQASLATSRYIAGLSVAANVVTRIIYSRAASALALLGALAFTGVALAEWITGSGLPWADLGPELAGAALLAVTGFLLRRLRRVRR
jgi:hypothetical protein